MAKMDYAGENARYIFRRMPIFAGEDVGTADPQAMQVVAACAAAFEQVGMPEGRFHLATAALSGHRQKSNTTLPSSMRLNRSNGRQRRAQPSARRQS
ncbi:MAG: hypothetical protein R2867_05565 [Caldilineaceae bacterium]